MRRVLSRLCDVTFALVALAGAACGLPVFGTAIATQAPVIIWDKVEQQLAGATPGAQASFRAFKSWCNQNLRGISLQLFVISNLTAYVLLATGALRVYAVYVKKQGTATASYFKIYDDVASDATAANARVNLGLQEASKEGWLFFPDGLPFASGLVIAAFTLFVGSNGTTASTSGDGPNGFILVG